jgi:predicted nucleotidyltransferase
MGRIAAKPTAKRPHESGMGQALFSRVRLRVLGILFGHPNRGHSASEIIRLARSGSGAVQRELARLEGSGVLTASRSGNRKEYRANRASPIFKELRSLVLKTVGLHAPIAGALQPYQAKIDAAFVYGSIARGSDKAASDVDLMVIGGDLSYSDLYAALQSAERILQRPINPNLMTLTEWKKKLNDKHSLVTKISSQPRLFIIGSRDDLEGTG